MLIESLAQKTRLAMMTIVAITASCAIICGFAVWYCISLANKEGQQVYVLDDDTSFLAEHVQLEANFTIETKAHIQPFHQYFFNPPPDNDYIKWTLGRATYMADGTALKQKQASDENDFYSDIMSSSTVCTIICDSTLLGGHKRKFAYYGMQPIKRRIKDLRCSVIATGYIENMPRIRNNPHGLMIMNWGTIENKNLDYWRITPYRRKYEITQKNRACPPLEDI